MLENITSSNTMPSFSVAHLQQKPKIRMIANSAVGG